MKQVKLFVGDSYDNSKIETRLNEWIESNKIEIVDIKLSSFALGSMCEKHSILAIYEKEDLQ